MIDPSSLAMHVSPVDFIAKAIKAATTAEIDKILAELPIAPEDQYTYKEESPEDGWQQGKFHWIPVGRERGNAGRIK